MKADGNKLSKVLIIDDDHRNIFALKEVVKCRGYAVVTAANGHDGLKLLAEQKDIAVVLLDMMMPQMDGYEVIRVIRQELNESIPVIAVTAQAMLGDREKCLAAGANDYIAKPIDIDHLAIVLQRQLN